METASALSDLGCHVSCHVRWHAELLPKSDVRIFVDPKFRQVTDEYDLAYIHAAWTEHSLFAMLWCLFHRIPYVFAPHGSFMPRVFTRGKFKKRLMLLALRPLISRAKRIMVTSDEEADACRAIGIRGPFVVIPLGCHLPEVEKVKVRGEVESSSAKATEDRQRMVLFLGRLGEEKGLELLLDAWKEIKKSAVQLHTSTSTTNWKLVIAGPSWEGYGERLRAKVEVEKIKGVEFPGNADEAMKDRLYRAADVFVLSSPMENFSMVVLDALAYGVPVICTKGTPWRVIAEKNAGWWIEPNSSAAIRAALEEAMDLSDEERQAMGARGREIAAGYAWSEIAKKMEEL